jgi:hypothetical protein
MAASVKFPVISRNVVFAGNGVFSPETRAKAFAEMARGSIVEIDRANDAMLGRDVHYRTFVDGRETESLAGVKETSEIVARWDLVPGVIAYIDGLLANAGPRLSGDYRRLRAIYADGVEITDPLKAAGAREVLFLSLVPYARKIESGKKGYAPGHVYEAVAAMAKSRFSNVALIKFTYAEPEGPAPALDRWAATSATAAAQRKKKGRDNPRRQPAILVYL